MQTSTIVKMLFVTMEEAVSIKSMVTSVTALQDTLETTAVRMNTTGCPYFVS